MLYFTMMIIVLIIYIVAVIFTSKWSRKRISSEVQNITDVATSAIDDSRKIVDECIDRCRNILELYPKNGLVDTDAFRLTVGLIAGYNYENDEKVYELVEKLHNFPAVLNRICEEVESETKCYISFNIRTVTTLYKKEWGCPDGGETCYEISAIRNPVFVPFEQSQDWIRSCIMIAEKLKTEYNQSSVTGELYRTNILYIKNQDNTGKTEMLTSINDKQMTKSVKETLKESLNK